jgi:predicted nucleic acid-binding protein
VSFVLDSSVALSWCFRDEWSPESRQFLEAARIRAVFVPALWHMEMANILGLAFRKKRLSEADLSLDLKMLAALELHTDTSFQPIGASILLPLMQAYSLTAYDAAYLELAIRLDLPLATLDSDLATAAKNAGLTLVHESK